MNTEDVKHNKDYNKFVRDFKYQTKNLIESGNYSLVIKNIEDTFNNFKNQMEKDTFFCDGTCVGTHGAYCTGSCGQGCMSCSGEYCSCSGGYSLKQTLLKPSIKKQPILKESVSWGANYPQGWCLVYSPNAGDYPTCFTEVTVQDKNHTK